MTARRLAQSFSFLMLARRPWQLLLITLLLVVSYLALVPTPSHVLDTGWDKLNHSLAFVALAGSAYLGYARAKRSWLLIPLAVLAFGGGIEVVQAFIPSRSADWADLLADAIGVTAGTSLAWTLAQVATMVTRRKAPLAAH